MWRLVLSLSLLALSSAAQTPERVILSPVALPFQERFTDRVPVSGRFLVGLMATAGADQPVGAGLATGRLSVLRLSGHSAEQICVRATIQDGRYAAENAFGPLPGMSPPTLSLAWPTAHAAPLRTIPLREVAALATLGPCATREAPVLPTIAEGGGTGPLHLHALTNTRGAATWAVLRDPEAGGPALRRVRCARLEDGSRVAFDARCPLGPPPAGHTRLELRIEQQSRDGSGVEVVERLALLLTPIDP